MKHKDDREKKPWIHFIQITCRITGGNSQKLFSQIESRRSAAATNYFGSVFIGSKDYQDVRF